MPVAFDFSHQGHALVTLYVQFLCSDWSKFDRWAHAENLCSILNLFYFDSWSWQSLCQLVMFLTVFSTGYTKWNTAAIKSLLLFIAGLFIGFCLRNASLMKVGNPILVGIVFVFHLAWSEMLKRVKNSQAILALLDSFQGLHLEW